MTAINPYLNFKGNTEEAFNFYRSVFGGEFIALQRFKDTSEAGKTPAHEQDKIVIVQNKFMAIKEWADTGFAINFVGAVASRAFVGARTGEIIAHHCTDIHVYSVFFVEKDRADQWRSNNFFRRVKSLNFFS